jgi:prevent-host-death family protein
MTIYNMHQAKTDLSKLVARAEAGEEIVIARHNVPVAKIVPVRGAIGKEKAPMAAPGGFGEEAQMGLTGMDEFHGSKAGSLAPARKPGVSPEAVTEGLDSALFVHAPDDYISKDDIAAYYRSHREEWAEMQQRVGVEADSLAAPLAKRVRGFGSLSHMPPIPDSFFFDPLPDEELDAWEGTASIRDKT